MCSSSQLRVSTFSAEGHDLVLRLGLATPRPARTSFRPPPAPRSSIHADLLIGYPHRYCIGDYRSVNGCCRASRAGSQASTSRHR